MGVPHTLVLLALAATSAVAQDVMGVWTVRHFVPDFQLAKPMCRGTAPGVNFDLVDYDRDVSRQLRTPEYYFSTVMRSGGPWVCTCLTPGDSSNSAVRLCLGDPSFWIDANPGGMGDLHVMEEKSGNFTTQSTAVAMSFNTTGGPLLFTEQYTEFDKPQIAAIKGVTFPMQTVGDVPGRIIKSAAPRGEIVSARGWRSPAEGHPGRVAVGMWYAFPKSDDSGLLCRAYRLLSDIEPAAEVAAISKIGYEPQCLDLPCSGDAPCTELCAFVKAGDFTAVLVQRVKSSPGTIFDITGLTVNVGEAEIGALNPSSDTRVAPPCDKESQYFVDSTTIAKYEINPATQSNEINVSINGGSPRLLATWLY